MPPPAFRCSGINNPGGLDLARDLGLHFPDLSHRFLLCRPGRAYRALVSVPQGQRERNSDADGVGLIGGLVLVEEEG